MNCVCLHTFMHTCMHNIARRASTLHYVTLLKRSGVAKLFGGEGSAPSLGLRGGGARAQLPPRPCAHRSPTHREPSDARRGDEALRLPPKRYLEGSRLPQPPKAPRGVRGWVGGRDGRAAGPHGDPRADGCKGLLHPSSHPCGHAACPEARVTPTNELVLPSSVWVKAARPMRAWRASFQWPSTAR